MLVRHLSARHSKLKSTSSLLSFCLIVTAILLLYTILVLVGSVRVDAFLRRYLWMPLWESSSAEEKLRLPKFQYNGLPLVLVNSMVRSQERQKHLMQQLTREGFNKSAVEIFNGFDPREQGIQWEELAPYFGTTRLRKSGFQIPQCRLPPSIHTNQLCSDSSAFERAKVACDVTYLRILHRLAADAKLDFALVLEDDVLLENNFLFHLEKLMQELPEDWDLLMLYAFKPHVGAQIGQRLAVLKSAAGAVAFLIRRKAVFTALEMAPWALPHMYIDNLVMGNLPETGRINAYIAQPLLCWHSGTFKSNIDV